MEDLIRKSFNVDVYIGIVIGIYIAWQIGQRVWFRFSPKAKNRRTDLEKELRALKKVCDETLRLHLRKRTDGSLTWDYPEELLCSEREMLKLAKESSHNLSRIITVMELIYPVVRDTHEQTAIIKSHTVK